MLKTKVLCTGKLHKQVPSNILKMITQKQAMKICVPEKIKKPYMRMLWDS